MKPGIVTESKVTAKREVNIWGKSVESIRLKLKWQQKQLYQALSKQNLFKMVAILRDHKRTVQQKTISYCLHIEQDSCCAFSSKKMERGSFGVLCPIPYLLSTVGGTVCG